MDDVKRVRPNFSTTAVVLIVLAAIVCMELVIQLIPFRGAIKSDLKDYSTYPIMMVSLSDIRNNADIDDHSAAYCIKWDKGSMLQNAVVQVSFYSGETSVSALSSELISVSCNGLFFKKTGDSINISEDITYIQITGYRKTLFFTGGAEQFGFAVKIMVD